MNVEIDKSKARREVGDPGCDVGVAVGGEFRV